MPREWQELTRLTQGKPIIIERVRLVGSDIAIEGSFELPPLARLSAEDQIFIMAFVQSDGSIKEMEKTLESFAILRVQQEIQRAPCFPTGV